MNRVSVALLISLVVAGHAITIVLLRSGRSHDPGAHVTAADATDASLAPVLEAIDSLRRDVDRLSATRSLAPSATSTKPAGEEATTGADGALGKRLDELVGRLKELEQMLVTMKDVEAELAVAKLRKEREEQLRSEEGYKLADELLALKQFALAGEGILTFLEAHPDHPDARDLMNKAVVAFQNGGYGEKALWLQGEMMEKFPDPTGQDLYSRAMLEKRVGKLDDALLHINKSIELSPTEQDRLNRLYYRAFLIHQRDGDGAGLEAYREVERLSKAAGTKYPAGAAGKRVSEIEARLAGR